MKQLAITALIIIFVTGLSIKLFSGFEFQKTSEPDKSQALKAFYPERTQSNISDSTIAINQKLTSINEVILATKQQYSKEKKIDNSGQILNDRTYTTPNQNPNFLPIRDWSIPLIELPAKAIIVTDQTASKIFYQKNLYERLPIASLTKLMTAIVVMENYGLDEVIKISQASVSQDGNAGHLIVGEEITLRNALKALLIESSNDSAYAIQEHLEKSGNDIINLMNQKAISLNLQNTHFVSPSGLVDENNYSTALDLSKLVAYSMNNATLWEIMGKAKTDISSADKSNLRHLINSNQLLGKIPEIIGGKTGFTEKAKGCLITVTKINNEVKIISIILGSDDRFPDMERLISWIKSAYRF